MLIVVGAMAALLGWFGYAYRRIEWRMEVVRALLDEGARPMQEEGELFSVPQPDGWEILMGNESSLKVAHVHALVSNGRLQAQTVRKLRRFPELQVLTLSGQPANDASIGELAELDSLTVLALDATDVTDASLDAIADMERLETLNLSLTSISDQGVEALVRLKNLKDLRLMDTRVTPAGVDVLRKRFPNAEIVYTSCPSEEQRAALVALARGGAEYGLDPQFGRTLTIALNEWKGSDKPLRRLAGIEEVDALVVNGFQAPGAWVGLVKRPSMLSALDFYDCGLSLEDIAWVGQAENLRLLSIGHDKLDNQVIAQVGGLGKLQTLNLYESNSTVTDWQPLAGLQNLRQLILDDAPLKDDDTRFLESTPDLERLSLCRTTVTNASVPRIARLGKLTDLRLDGTNITDDCIEQLKTMRSLTFLSVFESRISPRGVEDLRAALPSCTVH